MRIQILCALASLALIACDTPAGPEKAAEVVPAGAPTQAAPAKKSPAAEENADPLAAPKDVAAPPADATKTASGLAHKVIKAGTGSQHPTPQNKVTVHYSGWQTDGKMFDSSVQRGQPATFPLGGVIAGWTEGVQLMVVGEKRRFWIPESLAYQGQAGPPAGMLVFDVELLEIQ